MTHGAPVASRSRVDLRQEDPGEDVASNPGSSPAPPPGMEVDEVELRSELARSLRPGAFPAEAGRLREVAAAQRAPVWVLAALNQLPHDRRFEVLEDLFEALGEHGEDSTRRS